MRLVGIGVVEGHDGIAKMPEGILPSLKDFLSAKRPVRALRSMPAGGAVPRAPAMPQFAAVMWVKTSPTERTPLGGTPSVLLRRHGFGKARVALLLVGDLII